MFPAIFFFFPPHWLYGNTVPFFSWRPSWCLSFAYQVLPSSLIGAAQTLLVKTGLHTLLCKLKVCFPWRGLVLFSRSFLEGRVGSECVQPKPRACRCHPGGTCPSAHQGGWTPGPWLPAAPCLCLQSEIFRIFLAQYSRI